MRKLAALFLIPVPGLAATSSQLDLATTLGSLLFVIIQVGEEQYLIGVTTQSIQLLAKLDNPLIQEELPATAFSNQLMQLLKKHETDSKT